MATGRELKEEERKAFNELAQEIEICVKKRHPEIALSTLMNITVSISRFFKVSKAELMEAMSKCYDIHGEQR